MEYKLILENWKRFTEQMSAPEEEAKMDQAEKELEKQGSQRPLGKEVSKKLPVVNGINFVLPIKDNQKINSGFKQKRGSYKGKPILHGAIDQNVPIGTECVAIADGEVIYAISQETYDNNCKDFLNIMRKEIFVPRDSSLKKALAHISGAEKYAKSRPRPIGFNAKKLRRRVKDEEWRAEALQKLNSVTNDWNGIRDFQRWLSGEQFTGSPRQICAASLRAGMHCNFCAMLMRYLLRRGKVNRRMMAGKYINILTDPDQNGQRWQVSYMHMDSYELNVGERVKAGQVVGTSGASGIADSSPHLHFVLRKGKKGPKRDPVKFIPGLGNNKNPQEIY